MRGLPIQGAAESDIELLQAILDELEARDRAAASFGHFVERTLPFPLEPWQWVLCDRLSKLPNQKGQRLLIHGFPQSGKSVLLSQRFPAWCLGVKPTMRIRLACYNQTHAERFSKVNLDLLRDPDYRNIFPSPDSRIPDLCPVEEWSTPARKALRDANPSFKALGLRSGFTGMGVDLGLIDDPYKNRAEAFSDTINEAIWYWWTTVFLSRLNPDTNVVVMFHRWKENDLAGRLIEQGGWEVLRFAAIGDGEPDDPMQRPAGVVLSPRYPLAYLENMRRQQGELDFLALFQGKPTNAAGTVFKKFHLLPIGGDGTVAVDDKVQFWPIPIQERIEEAYLTADTATTKNTSSDFTAIARTFKASDGYVYIYPLLLRKLDLDAVVKWVTLLWVRERRVVGDVLRSFRLELGSAGTPAVQQARTLIQRARVRPTPSDFDIDKVARVKHVSERTKEERDAMSRVAASYKPNDGWTVEEWEEVRAGAPLIFDAYQPGHLVEGGKGDLLARSNQIVPFVSGGNVRICADGENWSVARAWLGQLLAFPNGAHDDAVQATVGGVLPWVVNELDDKRESGIDEDMLANAMG